MVQPVHTLIKGQRFIPNLILTEPKTEEVPRTWSERLFSTPWRPLKKVKYVTTQVASRQVICINGDYFAHPDLIAEIVAATKLEEQ